MAVVKSTKHKAKFIEKFCELLHKQVSFLNLKRAYLLFSHGKNKSISILKFFKNVTIKYKQNNCAGPIKNELYYTDINTGRYQLLRTATKDRDDVPIVGIKVSYLHQVCYLCTFALLFRDRMYLSPG